jgi:Fic family protein
MLKELDDLIDFANDKDDTFIHPFIKAIILHFWI